MASLHSPPLSFHEKWGINQTSLSILISNLFLGCAMGFSLAWMPLALREFGNSAFWIGINASSSSVAVIITAFLIGRIVPIIGFRLCLIIGAAIYVLGMAMLAFDDGYWWWTFSRFFAAFGVTLHWIISEGWLNTMANRVNRARLMGLYVACLIGGLAIGPILIPFAGIVGYAPILLIVGIGLIGVLILFMAIDDKAKLPIMTLKDYMKLAGEIPRLLLLTLFMGMAQGAILSMLSFYGVSSGLSIQEATYIVTAFMAGSVLFQLVLGGLEAKIGHNLMLISFAFISAITALAVAPLLSNEPALYSLMIIRGGVLFGLYTIVLSALGNLYEGSGKLATISALLVLVWELGGMSGAPITGIAMEYLGAEGFNYIQFILCIIVLSLAVWRYFSPRKA